MAEPWNAPLRDEAEQQAQVASAAAGAPSDSWGREEIAQFWANAKTEHGELATLYCAQRGLDLELISPNEMRTEAGVR